MPWNRRPNSRAPCTYASVRVKSGHEEGSQVKARRRRGDEEDEGEAKHDSGGSFQEHCRWLAAGTDPASFVELRPVVAICGARAQHAKFGCWPGAC